MNPPRATLDEISRRLREERARLDQEVFEYPRPIPACDVQFNTLLERRAAAVAECGQWEALRQRAPEDRRALREWIRDSVILQEGEKASFAGDLE